MIKIKKYKNDAALTIIAIVTASIFWLLMALSTLVLGAALIFGILLFTISLVTAFHVSSVRGNGIKVSENQFPELNSIIVDISKKFNISIPDTFVIANGGILNSFAAKLFYQGKQCIALSADIITPLYESGDVNLIKMIIAHEIGHLKEGHRRLLLNVFLFPVKIMPFLGCALSRAHEYTADRYALAGCGSVEWAKNGIILLSAGKDFYKECDIEMYKLQYYDEYDYWGILGKLFFAKRPYTAERIIKMEEYSVNVLKNSEGKSYDG